MSMAISNRPALLKYIEMISHPLEISRHDSLYFKNGNLVLLSLPKDNIITAFRVFKDFLILNSPVFEGMFSVPLPREIEKYDGVPLVRLHDEAEHLTPFLNAIYDPTAVPIKRDFYFSFKQVQSIFMLSKKYQCDKLLECMRRMLLAIWPKYLEEFDSIRSSVQGENEDVEEYVIRSTLPEPCSAIRLAREFDVPAILPASFYYLLSLSEGSLDEMQIGGADLADHHHEIDVYFQPDVEFAYLSNDDFLRLFRGLYEIQGFLNDLYSLALSTAEGCQQQKQCSRALDRLIRAHKDQRDAERGEYDALCLLDETEGDSDLCAVCSHKYIKLMKVEGRKKLWKSLSDKFGLKPSV